MKQEINQAIRLRLLALVLALALTWYAVNPAPGSVRRVRKSREGEPRSSSLGSMGAGPGMRAVAHQPAQAEGESNELDWPEFIDLREG